MALSIWLSRYWFADLSDHIPAWLAAYLIGFIAIVPGFINAFIFVALLLDKRPGNTAVSLHPPVTVLIAALNEDASIAETLDSLFRQDYSGEVHVIVINDGSQDHTAAVVRDYMSLQPRLTLIDIAKNGGKAAALNRGLAACQTDWVITVDADCWIWHDGIANLVGRLLSDPPDTKAVAGEMLVRNSRENWITKAQEWDYFLGIAAIKRVQSLFQGTLVAQGAFSIYEHKTLVKLGGWPDTIGEDIVLTWQLLLAGHRIGHAENACAFTRCPNSLLQFTRQRQRWSRGLIEAFKINPGLLFKPRLTLLYIWWNLLFPLMDVAYTLGFIPGLVLACFGYFWIVGPMTLALLPISFLLNRVMYTRARNMFVAEHLIVRQNVLGLGLYALVYGLILQPACVWGYASEILKLKKTWGRQCTQ
jgi:biofilm PGA synthesis N-glycosyltransferase PgaC